MHTHALVLHQKFSNTRRLLIALLAALALLAAMVAMLSMADSAQAAGIPPHACTGSQTYNLYAVTGTLGLADGTTVNVWGYTNTVNAAPSIPGPTLVACDGDQVVITVHNGLSEASSLAVHGQSLAADMVGADPGSTKSYTFTAHAGTFVYQAGLTANGARQAALGMFGALVVYPTAAGQAYITTTTNFDAESLLVLSEIDPALNGVVPAPISTTFDMHDYAPKYWLINGKSYPQTDPIQAPAGSQLLLRYANAGFEEHSMSLLGLDQTIVAANGYLLPASRGVVAETVPPAGTLDTIVTMPASGQYALYDGNQHIDNNGAAALGGMLTFVGVPVVAPPPPVNQAPVVSAGTDQTVTLPSAATLAGTASDDGLPNPPALLTTTWSLVSGSGIVTFTDPAVLNTSVSFSAAGTYVLRLTGDDSALTASSDVTITVQPPANQAPVVSAGTDQTVTLPSAATLAGTASDDGLPNPPALLTTTWSLVSGSGIVTFTDPAVLNTSVSFSAAGTYVLRLTGDDSALTASSDVTITVQPPANQAPVVSAGTDQTVTLPSAATLAGTASDDGLPNPPALLTTTWSLVSGSGIVTFTDPAVLNTSVAFSTAGTYVLRLTGDDSALTASSDVTITVNADPAPTVSITDPAASATVSGTVTITATASDAAPGTVTQVEFFVDAVSVGVDTNGADGWSVVWDTTLITDGLHSLTAVATDDVSQATTSATVDVTVANTVVNAPQPVPVALPPVVILPKDKLPQAPVNPSPAQ